MLTDDFVENVIIWLKRTLDLEHPEVALLELDKIFFQTDMDSDALWLKIGLPLTMFDDDLEGDGLGNEAIAKAGGE